MPVVTAEQSPSFEHDGLAVTGHAAPTCGSRETSVWRIEIAPGTPGAPHTVDREEIFVALAGQARATVAGHEHDLAPGDTLIVPAGDEFSLANDGRQPFLAMCVLPVGGQACFPGGEPFVPPWAQ